ncbi:MAG: polymorphic toxin type 44 domain-containing protein [Lachnospirales bacterium]
MYGYLKTAAGFSEGILLKGGDFAAAGGNLSLTGLFNGIGGVFRSADSADDKANVRIGINWYNNR